MTTTITYSWETPVSPAMRAAWERAAESWDAVLDIDIVEATGATDWRLRDDATWGPGAALIGGPTMWVDGALEQQYGWGEGNYGAFVLRHEAGHLLGLAHPHELGSSATMAESIMSYLYIQSSSGVYLYPEESGLKDITDLAGVYGLNMASAGDGTVWRVDRADRIDTVYDVGGRGDMLDLRDIISGCDVDMTTMVVDMHDGWVFSAGIEAARLGAGADAVTLGAGMLLGLGKGDVLVTADDDADKLSRSEKRALDLDGRWWELGDTLILWSGSEKKLEALIYG